MQDQATEAAQITVTPIGGALGGRVEGIDLASPISQAAFAQIRQALLDYLVILFPNQGHLTPEQQIAFGKLWGEMHYTPAPDHCLPGHPEILVLETEGAPSTTDKWHSDVTMDECPPMGSILLARTIPVGGDTIFANQYLAYDALSDGMKRIIDGLRAVHNGEVFGRAGGIDPATLPSNLHPVVRTHPETGRKALFVNTIYTSHFEGMTVEESRPLLDYLRTHSVQPNFTFRHRWTEGDLLMWDNRCLQHFAVADYGAQRRVMHRVTILGDKPV